MNEHFNTSTEGRAERLSPQPLQRESPRAFEAFRAYLELGPRRRYAAVGRQVGASLRTVKGWARDFDWRGRVKTCAAQRAQQYLETETSVQREQLLDAAARAQAFHDRQYGVAEALLDVAERYLENLDGDDLDVMSFADACKALEVASRLGQQAARTAADDSGAPARTLRDQLVTLLDQACRETSSPPQLSPPRPSDGIEGRGEGQLVPS